MNIRAAPEVTLGPLSSQANSVLIGGHVEVIG